MWNCNYFILLNIDNIKSIMLLIPWQQTADSRHVCIFFVYIYYGNTKTILAPRIFVYIHYNDHIYEIKVQYPTENITNAVLCI